MPNALDLCPSPDPQRLWPPLKEGDLLSGGSLGPADVRLHSEAAFDFAFQLHLLFHLMPRCCVEKTQLSRKHTTQLLSAPHSFRETFLFFHTSLQFLFSTFLFSSLVILFNLILTRDIAERKANPRKHHPSIKISIANRDDSRVLPAFWFPPFSRCVCLAERTTSSRLIPQRSGSKRWSSTDPRLN